MSAEVRGGGRAGLGPDGELPVTQGWFKTYVRQFVEIDIDTRRMRAAAAGWPPVDEHAGSSCARMGVDGARARNCEEQRRREPRTRHVRAAA